MATSSPRKKISSSRSTVSRPGGRSARVKAAVLEAAMAELVEKGPGSFSLPGVARRAGVQRTSLYRRYGSATALLSELVRETAETRIPIPDTGSLEQDLVALVQRARALLSSPVGRALRGLALGDDAKGSAKARREYWRGRLQQLRVVFERAAARDELAHGVDPDLALSLVLGPLWFRLFVSAQPFDDRTVRRCLDLCARGWSAPGAGSERGRQTL